MVIRSPIGTGSPATTGCPFRWARNGNVATTYRVVFRHRVVHKSRMALSTKFVLDTTPELAANCAILLTRAKAAGPARRNLAWLAKTNRHAPVTECASPAVHIPFKRVLPLNSLTCITSCGLDCGGRHDRITGDQWQQVTSLGVAFRARGELLCSSLASCSALLSERGGDSRAGADGPAVAVAVQAVATVLRGGFFGVMFIRSLAVPEFSIFLRVTSNQRLDIATNDINYGTPTTANQP